MPYKDPSVRRERDRERFHRRTTERGAAGLCPRCGKRPPEPGRRVCATCGEKSRRAELDASAWRRAGEAAWRVAWNAETTGLPSHRDSRFWLATGLLLPVWDRLPAETMRVRRLTAAGGIALIGRVLDAGKVRDVRAAFGLAGGLAMTGTEAFEAVMDRGAALPLANGWRLARRRIMGAARVEDEVQQIRIVIDGMPGFVPTALVALTLDDAEDICDCLNRRLGLDRDAWTELAAGSMRAEDGDPDTESRH